MSGNADVTDRRVEFDQRVRLVVRVARAGLAVGTEVNVIAHGTLVPSPKDVSRIALVSRAERPIAADSNVNGLGSRAVDLVGNLQGLINGHKAMARVGHPGVGNAVDAVVPVGAVEALVAYTGNELEASSANVSSACCRRSYLVATIADSMVHLIASRCKLGIDVVRHDSAGYSWGEGVHRMVAMAIFGETISAEIIVCAVLAVEEL